MKTKSYIRLLGGLFLSVMFAMHASAQGSGTPALTEDPSIVKTGAVAPDFTTKMLDGRSVKLSDLKGKIVLINFWATWCGPCMKEFQVIPEKLLKRFEGEADFVFLPISRGETRETVQKKMVQLKESGIDFPVGLDPDRAIYDLYAKSAIPRNYLIGRDGKVVYASIGYAEEEFEKLVDTIAKLLK